MSVLRWIAVLPASFVCSVLATIIAIDVSRRITFLKVITGSIAGAVFVLVGGLVAPSHKTEAMIVLAIINSFYSLSQAKALSLAPGERIDWLSISRAFGGIIAAWDF
jgi:hypothetical protein